MNLINEMDKEILIKAINNISDKACLRFKREFIDEKDSYFENAECYFKERIQAYNFSEIWEFRNVLNQFWGGTEYEKVIPSILFLCEKLRDEDEPRFKGIDLVNYMM